MVVCEFVELLFVETVELLVVVGTVVDVAIESVGLGGLVDSGPPALHFKKLGEQHHKI